MFVVLTPRPRDTTPEHYDEAIPGRRLVRERESSRGVCGRELPDGIAWRPGSRTGVSPAMYLVWKRTASAVRPRVGKIARLCPHELPVAGNLRPVLLEAFRGPRGPRQRLVWSGPRIRACCIPDPGVRAAWWAAIREAPPAFAAGEVESLYERLREVVPESATEQGKSRWDWLIEDDTLD